MREEFTKILLPKGEWLDSMLIAFKAAGLEITAKPRSYEYSFVTQALPIIFQAVRSKEVIEVINDADTNANVGFTGTDIILEQGQDIKQPRAWSFPLSDLNQQAPKPKVYLGSTPHLRRTVQNPSVFDLNGKTIYTEYPALTRKMAVAAGITVKIKAVQGGSEGRWRIDSDNGGIVSIRNTDETMRANEIEPIIDILSAGILCIEANNVSKQDQLRVDELRELIYRALSG